MPPKKDKKSDAPDGATPADDAAKAALEILSLQERLRSTSERLANLESEHKKVVAQLSLQKEDQKEIFEYLNMQMRNMSQQLLSKDQQIKETEEQTQRREAALADKLQAQQDAQQVHMATLQQQISSYEEELMALQSFQHKRLKLEEDLVETKAFIENERVRHKQALQDIERRTIIEKDRLKKEFDIKMEATRKELLKAAEAHLDAATKATIAANESMKGELAFQSKECDRLVKTNMQLLEENRCLRLERQLLVQSEQEFGKRNHAYLSTTKSLLVKLKELDEKCRAQRGAPTLDDLPQEDQVLLRRQLDRLTVEKDALHEQLTLELARARAWNGLADDSLQFLLRTMSDASAALADPSSLSPWTPADGVPARLESLSNEQRVRSPLRSLSRLRVTHAHQQVRVLKFFVAKLSMFVDERSRVDSAAFLGDLPLGKELPGNELPAIPTMRRASATGTGVQHSVNYAALSPSLPGHHPLHSHNQDALQPRAKKDKHATFTSPPPHLLPSAATPLRGSPMPSAAAGAGHNGGLSPSVLNQGVTHQSLSSKADGSGRFGPGGSPRRGDVHAKIDVRL